jgi:hypothetical protein
VKPDIKVRLNRCKAGLLNYQKGEGKMYSIEMIKHLNNLEVKKLQRLQREAIREFKKTSTGEKKK